MIDNQDPDRNQGGLFAGVAEGADADFVAENRPIAGAAQDAIEGTVSGDDGRTHQLTREQAAAMWATFDALKAFDTMHVRVQKGDRVLRIEVTKGITV